MKYFFIPGRLSELSWKELDSVCKTFFKSQEYILKKHPEYFLLDIDLDIDFLFPRLGGFLKYGVLLEENFDIRKLIDKQKVIFGISSYTERYSFKDLEILSKKIKEEYLQLKKRARFVLPREGKTLTTAQVLNHNLLQDGFELVLFEHNYGKTLNIQDIDSFYKRDYEKPFVDTKMGVLPVKLARMMINYAEISKDKYLWDPFCGSGNVLLEGLELGYNVVGSDIDTDAIDGSKMNLNWSKEKFKYVNNFKVFYLDVLNPSKSKINDLRAMDIDGIVCEPFMGTPQKKLLSVPKANHLINQHLNLVIQLFNILNELNISKKIKIVVVFPEYKTNKGWVSVDKSRLNFKNCKFLNDKDLHWSRRNSIIRRLIFIFEYNFK